MKPNIIEKSINLIPATMKTKNIFVAKKTLN